MSIEIFQCSSENLAASVSDSEETPSDELSPSGEREVGEHRVQESNVSQLKRANGEYDDNACQGHQQAKSVGKQSESSPERAPGPSDEDSEKPFVATVPDAMPDTPTPSDSADFTIGIAPIEVGTPSSKVTTVAIDPRYESFPYRPDTVIDGWSNDALTVRGASLRGHSHRYSGTPRQDDFAIHQLPGGRLIAVVADGVSSAKQSHLGASIAVRQSAKKLREVTPRTAADWIEVFHDARYALIASLQRLELDGCDIEDANELLATTLVCAVIEPTGDDHFDVFIAGIGDSGAWILQDGEFTSVLGGKSADESGISPTCVTGLPLIPDNIEPYQGTLRPGEVLLLATDGIGDPLGHGHGGVGDLFRQLLAPDSPPSILEFAHAVDFSRERFDDDRTLVAVIAHQKPQDHSADAISADHREPDPEAIHDRDDRP